MQCFHRLHQVVWEKAPRPHTSRLGVKGRCTNNKTPPDLPSTRTRPYRGFMSNKNTSTWGSRRQHETPALPGCRSCLNLISNHSPCCKGWWRGGSFCSTGSCLCSTHSRRPSFLNNSSLDLHIKLLEHQIVTLSSWGLLESMLLLQLPIVLIPLSTLSLFTKELIITKASFFNACCIMCKLIFWKALFLGQNWVIQLFLVSCATSNYKLPKSLLSLVILQDKKASERYVIVLIPSQLLFQFI